MDYKNLLIEKNEGIQLITINRPDKLNALNKETLAEINQAFKAAENDQDVKVVIVTGSGEKAFVAGADISEFASFSDAEGKELSRSGQELVFDMIENFPKPVIAAVNGFALGGGLELAMACHIRVGSDNAKLGLPEVSLGVIPGYGGTQRLPQLVGKGRAFEMIMTADMVNAQDAFRMGLLNHVVTLDELAAKASAIAKRITTRSPRALTAAIKAVNSGFKSEENGFAREIQEFGNCFGTEDFKEGTTAFLEKRKPAFPGK